MKICPNCHSEVDDTYDMCWCCCYSFPEGKVIDLEELRSNPRNINCLRHGIYGCVQIFRRGTSGCSG